MFKKINKRQLLALISNIILIILELIGFYLSITKHNKLLIKYYTQNSNLIALAASLLFVIYGFIAIFNTKANIPKWVKKARYVATCSLSLTLFMVLLTPLPFSNKNFVNVMFKESALYHHTLCPLLSIVSFVIFEDYGKKKLGDILSALSFTFIYGFVIVLANILKILNGPYPFLFVYSQPAYATFIYIVSILFCAYVIDNLVIFFNNKITNIIKNKHFKKEKARIEKSP